MLGNQNAKFHSNGNTLNKLNLEVTIFLLLFMALGLAKGANNIEASDNSVARKDSRFEYTWRKSANVLSSLFGTIDIEIHEGTDICDIDAFERFLRNLAKNTEVRLVKKIATIEELSQLPTPVILIRKDRLDFGVFLNSHETEEGKVYQILSASSKPFLLSHEQISQWWSGDVWYTKTQGNREIIYDIGEDSIISVSGTYHNIGLIDAKPTDLTHFETSIRVKNIGRHPIKISRIKTSCSCTVGEISGDRIVKPGEDTDISVSLEVPTGKGGVRYLVIVPFHDLKSQTSSNFKYEIIGNFIDNGLEISPLRLRFVDIGGAGTNERIIRVSERGTIRIKTIKAESSANSISVKLINTTVHSGLRTYYFKVLVNPALLTPGSHNKEIIKISTDHPKYTDYLIPVELTTAPEIKCIPSIVAYGFCEPNQTVTKNIILEATGDKNLKVRYCETTDGVRVNVKENGDNIELSVIARMTKVGMWKSHVKIYFDEPANGKLTIPLYAIVKERKKISE